MSSIYSNILMSSLSIYSLDLFLVIVVSGGAKDAESLSSVEVLHANGSFLCELPSLPSPREGATQEGLVLCGGYDRNADNSSQDQTKTSCLSLQL